MRPSESLKIHRQEIKALLLSMGFSNLILFGSASRGDDREGSDIDIMASFPCDVPFWKAGGEASEKILELTGCKADICSDEAAPVSLWKYIRKEGQPL